MENETLLKLPRTPNSDDEEIDRSFGRLIEPTSLPRWNDNKSLTIAMRILPWIAHFVFFSASLFMFVRATAIKDSLAENCLEAKRQWSNVMGSIPEKYHFERANGTFDTSSSPYKGPPSPAVDKAWAELTEYGAIRITEEIFQTLNASKNAVKVPAEHGGGRQAFVEEVLWQHTYPDYYVEVAESTRQNDLEWHAHNDHCADMLRQKLMCDGDIHLLTYNWLKGHDAPHPNFNTPRQCRDFEVIKKYILDNTLDGSKLPGRHFMKPKDGSVREYSEPPFAPSDDGWPSQP